MNQSIVMTFVLAAGFSLMALPAAADEAFPTALSEDGASSERASAWERFSSKFDTDGDGVVSQQEFEQADNRFERMDANDDGQLTEDDFADRGGRLSRLARRSRGGHGPGSAGLIGAADADKSGTVTAGEWQNFTAALDGDGDGVISREEVRALIELKAEKRFGERGLRGGGSERSSMSRLDTDKSGAVETSEFQAIFDGLDADGNGEISGDELPSRFPRLRSGGPGGRGSSKLLKLADADQDSQLTTDEWQAFLSALDADGNGLVTEAERAAMRPEDASAPPFTVPDIEVSRLEGLFARLDADGDGTLVEDEWPRRRGPRGPGGR